MAALGATPNVGGRTPRPAGTHGRQHGPALLLISGHAAEGVGQRGRNAKDEHHLDEIGEGRRVLERMRAVGVEEAAAVGAQLLDRFLRRHGAEGNDLRRAFQGLDVQVGRKFCTTPCDTSTNVKTTLMGRST
jgi:hypothetical protein